MSSGCPQQLGAPCNPPDRTHQGAPGLALAMTTEMDKNGVVTKKETTSLLFSNNPQNIFDQIQLNFNHRSYSVRNLIKAIDKFLF